MDKINLDNHYKPDYVIIKGKKKLVNELKKEVKNADYVYLATDPDREGEAISWHLYDTLGLDDNTYRRIVFNEITKNVILDSFQHARMIDDNLVKSQETRRMLDRIIGFRLSKLMQFKTGGKSAGRVQSVALKLIVDRQNEIDRLKFSFQISNDKENGSLYFGGLPESIINEYSYKTVIPLSDKSSKFWEIKIDYLFIGEISYLYSNTYIQNNYKVRLFQFFA